MNYILKDKNEPTRLNEQSLMEEFSIPRELEALGGMQSVSKLLDVGCGSGVLSRFVEENYPEVKVNGCDISENSLSYCRLNSQKKDSSYFLHNMLKSPVDGRFDLIVSRLVFHHLSLEQQRIFLTNMKASLLPSGKICVIDTDGLFLNLGTTCMELLEQMEFARSKFTGNVLSSRYLPALMTDIGLRDVSWKIETMDFKGASKKMEVAQWKARFESSIEFYISVFGSEFKARKFIKLYLDEANKSQTTMFYNKFIVTGIGP